MGSHQLRDPNLNHNVQVTLSRRIGKADQLLGNFTTNLAECWMHFRTKFGNQLIPKWPLWAQFDQGMFTEKYGKRVRSKGMETDG